MSNAEREWQDELKNMPKDELIAMVNHFRDMAMDLQYQVDFKYGRCEKCRAPLNMDKVCIYDAKHKEEEDDT